MPLPGWTMHGKGSSMSDVIYKGYTVKLRSRPLPSGMWEPRAIVWWEEDNMSNYEPISTGESQDTEALQMPWYWRARKRGSMQKSSNAHRSGGD